MCIISVLIESNSNTRTTISTEGHLIWSNDDNKYFAIPYMIYLLLPFLLYMDDKKLKSIIIFGCILTYIYSASVYSDSWGSNWCYFANGLSAVTLVWPYI